MAVESGPTWAYVETAPDGTYLLSPLVPGDYLLSFYDTQTRGLLTEYWDNSNFRDSAMSVTVFAAADTPNIDAQLELGGSISGMVTDDAGAPMSGVWLYAESADRTRYGSGVTSADGSYQIIGLEATDYSVAFFAPPDSGLLDEFWNDTHDPASATVLPVSIGVETLGIDAQFDLGGVISGVVTDDLGNPLEGAVVHARNPSSSWSATTAADGSYSVIGLRTGIYTVDFGSPPPHDLLGEYWDDVYDPALESTVSVVVGGETPNIDAQLQPWGSISGVVVDQNGLPLPGVHVVARLGEMGRTAVTGPGGDYRIKYLSPGDHSVRFRPLAVPDLMFEYWDNEFLAPSATPVTVSFGNEVTNIDARLDIGGSISGVVTDVAGLPIQGIPVWAISGVDIWQARTATDGSYRFRGMPSGSYTLKFAIDPGGLWLTKYWSDVHDEASASPVTVAGTAETSNMDVQLDRAPEIMGVVTDESSIPVFGATVYLSELDGPGRRSQSTGYDGSYRFMMVTPGDHVLSFTPPAGSGLLREYWDDVNDDAAATVVSAVPNFISSNLDVTLATGPPVCNGLAVTVNLGLGQSPTAGPDVILGTAGDDLIEALAGDDVVCAGAGDDTVLGGPGDDLIFGEDGADVLLGHAGNNVIHGGLGPDTIRGHNGLDTLFGGPGDDDIYGGRADDVIQGGSGADLIVGAAGNDSIDGGPGNDLLVGGTGDDTMSGGTGDDVLYLSAGDDTGSGDAGLDEVRGGGGLDTIDGGAGSDSLYGAVLDDAITGGDGDDLIWGGPGNDVLDGDFGDDVIRGGAGVDTIGGGPGHDLLNGDAGADVMSGGAGNDVIKGQNGDDSLDGGAGRDRLIGGGGSDALVGGPGGPDMCNGGIQIDTADPSCENVLNVP